MRASLHCTVALGIDRGRYCATHVKPMSWPYITCADLAMYVPCDAPHSPTRFQKRVYDIAR